MVATAISCPGVLLLLHIADREDLVGIRVSLWKPVIADLYVARANEEIWGEIGSDVGAVEVDSGTSRHRHVLRLSHKLYPARGPQTVATEG